MTKLERITGFTAESTLYDLQHEYSLRTSNASSPNGARVIPQVTIIW